MIKFQQLVLQQEHVILCHRGSSLANDSCLNTIWCYAGIEMEKFFTFKMKLIIATLILLCLRRSWHNQCFLATLHCGEVGAGLWSKVDQHSSHTRLLHVLHPFLVFLQSHFESVEVSWSPYLSLIHISEPTRPY